MSQQNSINSPCSTRANDYVDCLNTDIPSEDCTYSNNHFGGGICGDGRGFSSTHKLRSQFLRNQTQPDHTEDYHVYATDTQEHGDDRLCLEGENDCWYDDWMLADEYWQSRSACNKELINQPNYWDKTM